MDTQTYNYKVVRQFAIMTVVWGVVGMLVWRYRRCPAFCSGPRFIQYRTLVPLWPPAVLCTPMRLFLHSVVVV